MDLKRKVLIIALALLFALIIKNFAEKLYAKEVAKQDITYIEWTSDELRR